MTGRPASAVRDRVPAIAVLLMAALLLGGVPAAAQTDADEVGDLDLAVTGLTGAVSPDADFALTLRVTNRAEEPEEGLRIVATFHRRAFHRLDFARAVDEGRVGDVYTSVTADVGVLPARRSQTVRLRRSAAELGFGSDQVQGVYPLIVRLLRADSTVATVRTAVVVVSAEVEQPLRTALVAPLDAPPALAPQGLLRPEILRRDLAPRGRLRALLSDLAGRPDVPVTFAVDARMLDDVADFADGYRSSADGEVRDHGPDTALARAAAGFLRQLGGVLGQAQVEAVALPYGPADLSALVRGGMAGEAVRLISEGRARIESHTGARPARGVLLPADGISPAALSEAVSAGVDTLVVGRDHLADDGGASTASPSPVRRVRALNGATLDAAVPDPWLADLLADEGALADLDPAVAVQRLVAETATVYFERPFAEDRRGLLLLPPLQWDPPAGFATGLANALRAAPWLQPVTLSQLLDEVEPASASTTRVLYPDDARARELPRTYVAQLRASRSQLGSLAGLLAGDTETPRRFDRMLLTAASAWFRDDLADGLELIREITQAVGDLHGAVRITDSPTVLLSGIEGQLPVTVENTSSIPLRLAVTMETQRFTFEGGPTRVIEVPPGSTQTIAFRGRARSPGGTFPIRVVVEDVDGQLELAEGSLVVRSTAVSAAALALVVGAAVFLLVWWLRTFARRRGARRRAGPSGAT